MNALALYANSLLWIWLLSAHEQHGSAWAHKVMFSSTEVTTVPGYCGTCGVATNSLPCRSCQLEQRMQMMFLAVSASTNHEEEKP